MLAKMFTLFSLILLVSALNSCGSDKQTETVLRMYKNARKMGLHKLPRVADVHREATFEPYIKAFESYYGGSIGDISTKFGDSSTLALCRVSWDGAKSIVVNRSQWEMVSAMEDATGKLEILLFHELGHCVLERIAHTDHRVTMTTTDGRGQLVQHDAPASIMASGLTSEDLEWIGSHKERYLSELFDHEPVNAQGNPN